jgi:hypothetical protein
VVDARNARTSVRVALDPTTLAGAGSTSVTFIATATALGPATGAGSASVTFTASATGIHSLSGAGSTTLTFTASAHGVLGKSGAGSTSVTFRAVAAFSVAPPPGPEPYAEFLVQYLDFFGVWQDITCDVRTCDIDMGRQDILEQFSAGTLTLTMANFNDVYSGWPVLSIWAGANEYGAATDVPIKISMVTTVVTGGVVTASTVHHLFSGFTDSVSDSWPGPGVDAMVTVTASDGFKKLARYDGPQPAKDAAGNPITVGANETSGQRIARWASAAAWAAPDPAGPQTAIDTGLARMEASDMSGNGLQVMQDTAFADGLGILYCRADGVLVFRQRDALQSDTRMTTVQAIFVDTHDFTGLPSLLTSTPILLDAMETTANWTGTGLTNTILGHSGQAMRVPNPNTATYTIPTDQRPNEAGLSVWFRMQRTSLVASYLHIVQLYGGGAPLITAAISPLGDFRFTIGGHLGLIVGTGVGPTLTANTWHHLQLYVKVGQSNTAVVRGWIDGANITAGGETSLNVGAAGVSLVDSVVLYGDGNPTDFDDFALTNEGASTSAPPIVCYGDIAAVVDDTVVYNVAQFTAHDKALEQSYTDADSRLWYGPRVYPSKVLGVHEDNDALAAAIMTVVTHADNERRVDSITIDGGFDPDVWDVACGLQLLDRVEVIRHYPGGFLLDKELLVEGVHHHLEGTGTRAPQIWTTTYRTAAALDTTGFCAWDTGSWDQCRWAI